MLSIEWYKSCLMTWWVERRLTSQIRVLALMMSTSASDSSPGLACWWVNFVQREILAIAKTSHTDIWGFHHKP